MKSRTVLISSLVLAIATAMACVNDLHTTLGQLVESRRLSAELLVQFGKVVEAGNRAVMADTPDAAADASTDANAANKAIDGEAHALANALKELGYRQEQELLTEFQKRFDEFRVLDREILELAELDTNLKAQRLSFGAAQQAADSFRDALSAVAARSSAQTWQVRALVAEAVSNVREVQSLQAPHIAEPDDAAMTRLEQRIGVAQSAAVKALSALSDVSRPESKAALANARAALERFSGIHAEIVTLSRRNTNVRSLALALGRKRSLTAACEVALRALQEALANRELGARRS